VGPRPDVADELPHADVFLLPSVTESFGVAALEAMSAGVPVVAYRVGGIPDVVGEAGTLVEPFDVGAFADAVLAIVGDQARRNALGTAARARAVGRFDRLGVLDRWEAYLRRVCATPRRTVS
jgi:glycosyltransferase involved in cell wall biosynthesis